MSGPNEPGKTTTGPAGPRFDTAFAATFDDLLCWRRDVRRFRRDAIDPAVVERLLAKAHLSPSVGNSQPWRFVLVESAKARKAVRDSFLRANDRALAEYEGEQAALCARLKLAGLDEAPVQIAVSGDGDTVQGSGLGRRTMPEMLDYSVVCAVSTLWLAARVQGIGMGWVSILEPDVVMTALQVPPAWRLIAYLCLGIADEDHKDPELERAGWQSRTGLEHIPFRSNRSERNML